MTDRALHGSVLVPTRQQSLVLSVAVQLWKGEGQGEAEAGGFGAVAEKPGGVVVGVVG